MSDKFDSRKDSHSTKFKRRLGMLLKLSFRELSDSVYLVCVLLLILAISLS